MNADDKEEHNDEYNPNSDEEPEVENETKSKKKRKDKTKSKKSKHQDKKKKKKLSALDFIDIEAREKDDNDSEYFDEEEAIENAKFIDSKAEADDFNALEEQVLRAQEARRANNPDLMMSEQFDLERMAKAIDEKYKGVPLNELHTADMGRSELATERICFPTVHDPRLWLIPVKPGKGRQATQTLLEKAFQANHINNDPDKKYFITSVVCTDGKNFIYIEADKEIQAKVAATDLIREYLSPSFYTNETGGLVCVPLNQMTQALNVKFDNIAAQVSALTKKGAFVRVARGKDRGRLAQIIACDPNDVNVRIRMLPITNSINNNNITNDTANTKTFVTKDTKIDNLNIDNVNPSLSEIEGFRRLEHILSMSDEYDESGSLLANQATNLSIQNANNTNEEHPLSKGVLVKVIEGEMKNLIGEIVKIDGIYIILKPLIVGFDQNVKIEATSVRKFFKVGQHVTVLKGVHKNESGLISAVEEGLFDDKLIIFSTNSSTIIRVSSLDCVLFTQPLEAKDNLHGYKITDLLRLTGRAGTVMIIRILGERLTVIDLKNQTKVIEMTEIQFRYNTNKMKKEFDLDIGDIVTINEGSWKGIEGSVKNLFQGFVFIHSKSITDNFGYRSFPIRHVRKAGGVHVQPSYNISRGRDELIGHLIVITQGNHKGLKGIVKSVIGENVRIELQCEDRSVTVKRSSVMLPSEISAPVQPPDQKLQELVGYQALGARTPFIGQTPSYGSMTPGSLASMTPMHDAGFRTPRAGSQTPWTFDGGQTPGTIDAWQPKSPLKDGEDTYSFGQTSLDNSSLETGSNPIPEKVVVRYIPFNVEAKIIKYQDDGTYNLVNLVDEKQTYVASENDLEPVVPSEVNDCVIFKEDISQRGKITSVFEDDAVFEYTEGPTIGEISMQKISSLYKYIP